MAHKDHKKAARKQAIEISSIQLRPEGLAERVAWVWQHCSLQKVCAPSPSHSTNVHNNRGQRTAQKKAELEELWAKNTAQELGNEDMLLYHNAICFLHERTQEDYNIKKVQYRELKADLLRHHKQSIRQH